MVIYFLCFSCHSQLLLTKAILEIEMHFKILPFNMHAKMWMNIDMNSEPDVLSSLLHFWSCNFKKILCKYIYLYLHVCAHIHILTYNYILDVILYGNQWYFSNIKCTHYFSYSLKKLWFLFNPCSLKSMNIFLLTAFHH